MDDESVKLETSQVSNNTISLFIKKLWKMVNDPEAQEIISWSQNGDSFIIHDQMEFITKLLPHYFKHNNMASFIRQLNFYNFHKVPNVQDIIEFSHTCFLKDVPEVLGLIRRKNPVTKQKIEIDDKLPNVQDVLLNIKSLKGKHNLIEKELSMLKKENIALWGELNSLRVKYSKQSTIINMLIHFLITYIHSHQSPFTKTNNDSRNNIKVGPQLLEIGYRKNKKTGNNSYDVQSPDSNKSVTYSVNFPENSSDAKITNINGLEDILNMDGDNYPLKRLKKQKTGVTYSIELPQKLTQPEIQKSLLDILKENQSLVNEEVNVPEQEYTISYPAEYVDNSVDADTNVPLIEEQPSTSTNVAGDGDLDTYIVQSPPETITAPVSETKSKIKNIPKGKITKKTLLTSKGKSRAPTIKAKAPVPPSLSVSTNPETKLLEMLKENENLTHDSLETPVPDLTDTNLQTFPVAIPEEETLEDLLMDTNTLNTQSDPYILSDPVLSEKNPGILENPQEKLGMHIANAQEEINMLQDILYNLTSKDLNEILSVTPSNFADNLNMDTGQLGPSYDGIGEFIDTEDYEKNNLLGLENV